MNWLLCRYAVVCVVGLSAPVHADLAHDLVASAE